MLYKDANLVLVLCLRFHLLPLHVAFLFFVALSSSLEFYLCCLSRIVHFFLSFFVFSFQAIHKSDFVYELTETHVVQSTDNLL